MKRHSRAKLLKAFKPFLLGVVVTVIMTTAIVPAIANQIQIFYNSVNISVNGNRVIEAGEHFTLPTGEVIPYSINYRGTTFLPMRELGRLAGFEVDWDSSTRTVLMNTRVSQPEVEEGGAGEHEEEPEAPRPPVNTDEFEVITAAAAQTMFDNREHFVMVLLDSRRPVHEENLVEIRRVARAARVKLFAVDVADLPSEAIQPEFARESVPTLNHMARPVVFYVLGPRTVTVDASPTSTARLTRDFAYFRENYRPTTGGGGAGAFDITPNENMRRISLVELERRMADRGTFVLIYYSSTESFSYRLMTEVVHDAVLDSNRRVYILDGAEIIDTASGTRLQNSTHHWINRHGITVPQFPIVFFVRDGLIGPSEFPDIVAPHNSRSLENRIRDFFKE
ncbi:MAG: copper amine oxidase N-terminal domain-containing protein [Defluviitaleaceae bacterium]|nr:copper amine oxidase N-terminal domain-containing protein [Defluviitaleaceae bacterium]